MKQHIISSGSNKTLCGLKESDEIQGSSNGFGCDCDDCLKQGQKLIDVRN